MQKFLILSGMSGVGKDTVAKILMQNNPDIQKVKTCTTRSRRYESDGILENTYYYLTHDEFQKMIKNNDFLEWAKVHTEYYGSPKKEIEEIWKNKKIPLLVIDVQGLDSIKKSMSDNIVSIFLDYDPKVTIKERLLKTRPGISQEEITIRVKTAEDEKKKKNEYDYQVINFEGKPEDAANKIQEIINITIGKENK